MGLAYSGRNGLAIEGRCERLILNEESVSGVYLSAGRALASRWLGEASAVVQWRDSLLAGEQRVEGQELRLRYLWSRDTYVEASASHVADALYDEEWRVGIQVVRLLWGGAQ